MKSLIVCVALMSVYSAYGVQGQMYSGEWMQNLFNSIDRMRNNIQGNVQDFTQQIQENIRSQTREINQMTDEIQRAAAAGNLEGQVINTGVSGGSVVLNSVPGGSRSVISGYGTDGEPYFRQSEDRVVGNTLYHTDKIYNPSRRTMNEFHYTVDMSNPTARPILQAN